MHRDALLDDLPTWPSAPRAHHTLRAPRRPAGEPQGDQRLAETALLDQGRSALMAKNPAAALGALAEHRRRFPFVNIHHYFTDNVIWRRENPFTRYLRPARSEP